MKLNIEDIAKSLGLTTNAVDRWIRQGRIPVFRSGNQWSFDATVLKKWAEARNLMFRLPGEETAIEDDEELTDLLTAMKRGGVHHDITGDTVETLLRSAVDCVPDLSADTRQELYETLLEREQLTSTGIGKGVAIPHPRTPLSTAFDHSMIVTCFARQPVDYQAVDDRPVSVLFVLLSNGIKAHLHLLSRLAFCVRDNDFARFLQTSPDAPSLYDRIQTFERHLENSGAL